MVETSEVARSPLEIFAAVNPEIIDTLRSGWSLPFRGEIYDYAANIDLPRSGYAKPGPFRVSESKYLIEPFKALRNPRIRQVICLKAVQTGGSLIADLWVPYIIEHDPGPTLWLMQDDDAILKFLADRFFPIMRNTDSLRPWIEAAGRFGIKKDHLVFPHMSVVMGGLNVGNVQSASRRYVIGDEVWLAGNNGLIRQAKARTTAFAYNKKILLISQAGIEGDDLDLEWKQSDMREWNWQCLSCEKHQPFEMSKRREDGSWAGMKWDSNETTKPNGRWNYPAVAKTARLECFFCGHQVEDTPANRRRLDDTHRYIATNPGADETIAGFHWPAIANVDISFASIAVAYLQAKVQQEEHGYLLPLIEFTQKQLARPWSEYQSADFRRITYEPYEIASEWKEERFRFLTVDCQKDFKEFWFVVRAWAKNGESRQLDRGRLESWEHVAAKQAEWKIHDQDVAVDGGYEQTKVCDECVQHGHLGWRIVSGERRQVWICWQILKGSRLETFEHQHQQTKARELKIYDRGKYLTPTRMPSAVGRSRVGVPYFMFSALHVSDILRRHRDGEAAPWLCLPDVAPENDLLSFTNQMRSHIRVKERDEKGNLVNAWMPISLGGEGKINKKRPGHFFDAEKMQIVMALQRGIIGAAKEEMVSE